MNVNDALRTLQDVTVLSKQDAAEVRALIDTARVALGKLYALLSFEESDDEPRPAVHFTNKRRQPAGARPGDTWQKGGEGDVFELGPDGAWFIPAKVVGFAGDRPMTEADLRKNGEDARPLELAPHGEIIVDAAEAPHAFGDALVADDGTIYVSDDGGTWHETPQAEPVVRDRLSSMIRSEMDRIGWDEARACTALASRVGEEVESIRSCGTDVLADFYRRLRSKEVATS